MTPRLLDLFSGAGGAAVGYHRAGFDVVGVDIVNQPRYPFEFHQGDALTFPLDGFDVIHASPPCQHYSAAWPMHKLDHPALIEPVRVRLTASGLPWVIENVEGAPLASASSLFGDHGLMLCGTMFDLTVDVGGITHELRRHRLFETSWPVAPHPRGCRHRFQTIGVYGHGSTKHERGRRGFNVSTAAVRREVMGITWGNRDEIGEAIPPAYTEFVGAQLLAHYQATT